MVQLRKPLFQENLLTNRLTDCETITGHLLNVKVVPHWGDVYA